MWPLCRRSCRTHRTAWCRVPSTREEASRSSRRPPSARPRPLHGRAETPVTSSEEQTDKRTRMDYARGYVQESTGELEVWLFSLHLGIFSSPSCSRTLWQDTQLLTDILGFHLPSTMMPMPELATTCWICYGNQTREPVGYWTPER